MVETAYLRSLLISPEEESSLFNDGKAYEEYRQLYERQLLQEWELAGKGHKPLSAAEVLWKKIATMLPLKTKP